MPQTLFSCYMHVVFSTKNRVDLIPPAVEPELYAYIGGIVRNNNCALLIGGGTANHSHLLISLNKHMLLPELVGDIKRDSSKWIKTRSAMLSKFAWQDGYAAFSVGYKQIAAVTKYIADQKAHHGKKLFEDEMRGFYRSYGIEIDERYAWD